MEMQMMAQRLGRLGALLVLQDAGPRRLPRAAPRAGIACAPRAPRAASRWSPTGACARTARPTCTGRSRPPTTACSLSPRTARTASSPAAPRTPLRSPRRTLMERTFIMVKPNGVARGLVGEVIARFERRGFVLRGMKALRIDRALAERHYAEHIGKPFFEDLAAFITSGPVVAMVWEGREAITVARDDDGRHRLRAGGAGHDPRRLLAQQGGERRARLRRSRERGPRDRPVLRRGRACLTRSLARSGSARRRRTRWPSSSPVSSSRRARRSAGRSSSSSGSRSASS